MPWSTPSLRDVRAAIRDYIRGTLPGADASIPNSVLRVISDSQGAACHLTLQYIDWLSLQLLPDTAETEWLDRHGNIWLVNSDGTTGRKLATLAQGTVNLTGVDGTIAPQAMQLLYSVGAGQGVTYETLGQVTIGNGPTPVAVRALQTGSIGNAVEGAPLQVFNPPIGLDSVATAAADFYGGADTETDDELRARILQRIREPPMGGDASDYVAWAEAVPGVTRAWCSGNEMGVGTCTVRFMMDDLRADNGGFPLPSDCDAVAAYINTVRPVTVKELYVLAPLKQPINFGLANLNPDNDATRAAIVASIQQMLFQFAAPGQTIYAAWKSAAVMNAAGVISFDMTTQEDDVMPAPGYMATLGNVYWETAAMPPAPASARLMKPPALLTPPTAQQHGRSPRPTNRQ